MHNAHVFYERILPALNGVRPVQANSSGSAAWVPGVGGGDAAGGALVSSALREAAVLLGEGIVTADAYLALTRLQLLVMAQHDLAQVSSLAAHDAAVLDCACRSVSRECAERALDSNSLVSSSLLELCLECSIKLDKRRMDLEACSSLDNGARAAAAAANFCSGCTDALGAPGGACFPLFGRFRRDTDVDFLAGAALVPPITLPVELSSIPDIVDSYEAAGNLLRRTCDICALLSNQSHLIRHTYLMRFALLMHILTRVLPLPQPLFNAVTGAQAPAKHCFWRRSPIRRESQIYLLDLLRRTSRHFSCTALSIKVTRSLDAARILASGCIAIVSDAVVRRIAADSPSWLSFHYSGEAPGPTAPFGFDMGLYDVESRYSVFTEPSLSAARTIVLDYFAGLRVVVPAEGQIFAFERADILGAGERALLNQLCIQTGTSLLDQPEVYLTGERKDLALCRA